MTVEYDDRESRAGPDAAPGAVSSCAAPDAGRGAGIAAVAEAVLRVGKSLRETAVNPFGAELVDAEWHADSRMSRLLRHTRGADRVAHRGQGRRQPVGAGCSCSPTPRSLWSTRSMFEVSI